MKDKTLAPGFFDLLAKPFSVYNLEEYRILTLLTISSNMDCEAAVEVFGYMEPNVPFKEQILKYRERCYAETNNPLLKQAQKDLQEFQEEVDLPFSAYLLPQQ